MSDWVTPESATVNKESCVKLLSWLIKLSSNLLYPTLYFPSFVFSSPSSILTSLAYLLFLPALSLLRMEGMVVWCYFSDIVMIKIVILLPSLSLSFIFIRLSWTPQLCLNLGHSSFANNGSMPFLQKNHTSNLPTISIESNHCLISVNLHLASLSTNQAHYHSGIFPPKILKSQAKQLDKGWGRSYSR